MASSTQAGTRSTFNAEASTDLSGDANLGLAIALDANGDAILAVDATGDDCIGPLYDGGRNAGDPVSVTVDGPALFAGGAAINEADMCRSHSDSEWRPIGAADDNATCLAFQAGADGELFSGLVIHARGHAATP